MSCEIDKSVIFDKQELLGKELETIEESDIKTYDLNNKEITNLKNLSKQESIDSSTDSDVCLNYDSAQSDMEQKIKTEEKKQCGTENETTDSGSDDAGTSEKDSGCETTGFKEKGNVIDKNKKEEEDEEESPFEPPDDDLVKRIVDQVEFYFSDENIAKDAFLLKHVRRNKEGYVSLKLISSFKRVKHLAKNWRVVAYSLQKSTKLEVNEAKTKLRRVDPLPPFDQTTPSRTIVVINLPMDKPTIENVAEIFREFGEIALIRILRPGSSIPADVRSFANKHPEMNGTTSALIEFDRTESAKLAIDRMNDEYRGGSHDMKIIELNAPPSEKKKRMQNKKTVVNKFMEGELSSSCPSGSETEDAKFYSRRSSSPHPLRGADIPRLQRRFSANRVMESNFVCPDSYRDRPSCSCCKHCERRYSSSGSGYDSPVPSGYRRYSLNKEIQENGYQIPALRRLSGFDGSCCFLRRCSHDSVSGSDSSGSYTRSIDLGRRFSRDSISSTESGLQRRFSRDSLPSENITNYRRLSRDSVGSDVFAPPFLSRNNSRDLVDLPRRSSFGSPGNCNYHPLMHSNSRTSFGPQSVCTSNCSPHIPENVIRMPKGPDGSKGFVNTQ